MAKQVINIGTVADDGTGDPIRTAFDKVNGNFTELYNATNGARGKFDATAAPTANDDSANTSGNGVFGIGSQWIDVTGDNAYICVDDTATAAVWVDVSATGGASALGSLTDVTLSGEAAAHILVRNAGNTAYENVAMSGDVTIGATGQTAIGASKVTLAMLDDATLPYIQVLEGLSRTDGNFIVADGSTWTVESGATARTSLGLGSIATQAASSVAITGGQISGTTVLLQQGIAPTPTAEGDIWWDTDDNRLVIGDGTGQKTFSDDTQLAAASHTHAASDITSGTLAHERGGLEADVSAYDGLLKVSGGATSSVAAPSGTIVGTSDAQILTNKTITAPTLTLQSNTNPIPTTEGDIWWDSDDDAIVVGDGVGQKTFSDDTQVLARANHTGTQLMSTISDAGALATLSTVGTAQIDNSAVSYAKIQNVTATARILGRNSAGAGVVEEIAEGQFKALFNLEIGTDVQAFDAQLDDFSALSVTTDQTVRSNGSNWVAVKNDFAAATDPGASDDSGAGWVVGSVWINTTLDKVFICVDNSSAAAVWKDVSTSGGGGANAALDNLSGVAINTSLISDTDVTDNLGSAAVRWNDVYAARIATGDTAADTLKLSGYDVDGTAYVDVLTITANNTVTANLNSIVTYDSNQIVSVVSNAGDPTSVVTPDFAGQMCHDTTNDVIYISVGVTNTDWKAGGINSLTGTSGQIIVYDGSGVPTAVAMSGDATIAAGGAITIANQAVTLAMLDDTTLPGIQSIEGLGSAADKFLYTTAADTYAEGDITSGARGVLAVAHNLAATAAPTATDDTGSGYGPGSMWIDTTNDKAYVCLDGTSTAAVWTETTQSGGSPSLASLSDTTITSATSGDFLMHNGTAWVDQTTAEVKTTLALNNVENTALSTWAGSANITTLGTITTGAWTGTTIAVANGGTGATTAGGARTNLGLVIGTDVQAYNSGLALFAGVTHNFSATVAPTVNDDVTGGYGPGSHWIDTTNDKAYICLDGTDTAAVWTETTQSGGSPSLASLSDTTITAAAANDFLMHNGTAWVDTAPADARTALGLVIGTNVQAQDAGLQSIAGLTTAADKGIYTTASDTYATFDLTASARTFTGLTHNFSATAAPATGTDDTTLGYGPGSLWVDTTNDKAYICLDGTDTAAVWTEITGAGGSGPSVSSGAGAPGSTPSAVGDIYVDTTNDIVYLAAGTASSADWKEGGVGSVLPTDYTAATIVGADALMFGDNSDSGNVKYTTVTNFLSDLSIVTSPEFSDSTFRINDNTDATKQLAFEVSGITTATTRTWIVPDTNVTVSSFAATFLDDANGAAVMSTLGFGNVENTAISTWAGSANVTTLGTITTGTWNGTTIAVANGGTGATTAAGAATNLGLGTGNSPQFTGIELGHASDTTLTRSAAGVVAVEGVDLATIDDVETTTVNAQTGTTYTLVIGDRGQTVTMNNASANTLTIPTNASVAFAVGSVISVIQIGAGATTISGDTGVTVNGVSAGSGAINTRYNGVSLTKIATDTWIASGDIATVA